MNNRVVIAVVAYVLGMLMAVVIGRADTTQPNYEARVVKAVCDYGRSEFNGGSERACGVAQDVSGTEYLCSGYWDKVNCWVEDK